MAIPNPIKKAAAACGALLTGLTVGTVGRVAGNIGFGLAKIGEGVGRTLFGLGEVLASPIAACSGKGKETLKDGGIQIICGLQGLFFGLADVTQLSSLVSGHVY